LKLLKNEYQHKMIKVNFFIAGAPKAGTTSLYEYLDQHPQVGMSSIKEPNYFSSEELKKQSLYYKDVILNTLSEYEALFSNEKNKLILGEASVSYLFYPSVPAKIYAYNPDAKIIIMLRNPALRAFSHWQMDERLGFVNQSIEDIFYNKESENNQLYFQQYIQLGNYFEQVTRYINQFGRNNVMLIIQDEFKANAEQVLNELYTFLEIDSIHISAEKQHNTAKSFKNPILASLYTNQTLRKVAKSLMPGNLSDKLLNNITQPDTRRMSDDFRKKVSVYYKQDIQQLENLIGKDLSNWYK